MRPLLAACLLLSGCFFSDCTGSNPQPGVCDDPTSDPVTRLELGRSDDRGRFVPLADGDALPLRFGGQGALMATARVRLPELAPGTCVGLDVKLLRDDGTVAARSKTPLSLDDDGGDGVTPDVYLPGDFYTPVMPYALVARVGDVEVRAQVVIGKMAEEGEDLSTIDLTPPVDLADVVDLRPAD